VNSEHFLNSPARGSSEHEIKRLSFADLFYNLNYMADLLTNSESLIMSAILDLSNYACGVPIVEEPERNRHSMSVATLYVVLARLEERGLGWAAARIGRRCRIPAVLSTAGIGLLFVAWSIWKYYSLVSVWGSLQESLQSSTL
jgi:hypothetical protein